ncbi:hypothetical protein C8R44DRAFT_890836 [Mycena epipterygia]|nr:hypothetical protein C8R44DRAFT_890836 [Mycena epipterygia]
MEHGPPSSYSAPLLLDCFPVHPSQGMIPLPLRLEPADSSPYKKRRLSEDKPEETEETEETSKRREREARAEAEAMMDKDDEQANADFVEWVSTLDAVQETEEKEEVTTGWTTEDDDDRPVGAAQREDNRWIIPEALVVTYQDDLRNFCNALEAVTEHPKYDLFIWNPPLFEVELLSATYDSEADIQRVGAEAKRAILDIWGHLAWWTASVANWHEGVPEDIVRRIKALNFAATPKHGCIISLNRDWREINLPLLIKNDIAVFYVWGLFEQQDKRFSSLDPDILRSYHSECERREVTSLFGDEIPHMTRQWEMCARFDLFLEEREDLHSRTVRPAPVWGGDTEIIIHEIKDFKSWSRCKLVAGKEWRDLERCYHHVVVERRSEQQTIIIFLRFHHPCPSRNVLMDDGNFIEEELPEQDLLEIWERFKGRCVPRLDQIFDPITGIECMKELEAGETPKIERFENDMMLLPPPDGLGGRELRGRPGRWDADMDASRFHCDAGPRFISPSSERREEDSTRPMAYVSGWAQAMASPDSVSHYQGETLWRRTERDWCQTSRERRREPPVRSPSPDFTDARSTTSAVSTVQLSQAGSSRRSALPPRRWEGDFPIAVPFPHAFGPPCQEPVTETMEQLDLRRADWLNDMQLWGANFTYDYCLWRIPVEFLWDSHLLGDAYLILSKTSEVRL